MLLDSEEVPSARKCRDCPREGQSHLLERRNFGTFSRGDYGSFLLEDVLYCEACAVLYPNVL